MSIEEFRNSIEVSVITDDEDHDACYEINTTCWEDNDACFAAFNPGFGTEEGRERSIQRTSGWRKSTTFDKDGNPNIVFIKATVPASLAPDSAAKTADSKGRKIVGFAVWTQTSCVEGHGDQPSDDPVKSMQLDTLHPDDPKKLKFTAQMVSALTSKRYEVVRAKTHSTPTAILGCDLCVVDPHYQRRGIGDKLIRWGIEEAKRRGDMECVIEASKKGKGLYQKLGFVEQSDISFEGVEEPNLFEGRILLPTVFMRTRPES